MSDNKVFLTFATEEELFSIPAGNEGAIYYAQDTKKLYYWVEGKMIAANPEQNKLNLGMTLYELNQNIFSQMDPMNEQDVVVNGREIIADYFNNTQENHYMLLCAEYGYYTIFEKSRSEMPLASFEDTVLEIILELGGIYSIEKNDNGAIEIWIKPADSDQPKAFFLFPYDLGVVYYG